MRIRAVLISRRSRASHPGRVPVGPGDCQNVRILAPTEGQRGVSGAVSSKTPGSRARNARRLRNEVRGLTGPAEAPPAFAAFWRLKVGGGGGG